MGEKARENMHVENAQEGPFYKQFRQNIQDILEL